MVDGPDTTEGDETIGAWRLVAVNDSIWLAACLTQTPVAAVAAGADAAAAAATATTTEGACEWHLLGCTTTLQLPAKILVCSVRPRSVTGAELDRMHEAVGAPVTGVQSGIDLMGVLGVLGVHCCCGCNGCRCC